MENKRKNKIDKSLYSESSLSILNIRELRDMGRKLGMPSPTTMKKNDLIQYILKIVYGEIEIPTRGALGRPSRSDFDVEKYIGKIKSKTSMTDELLQYTLTETNYFGFDKVASATDEYAVEANIEQRVFYDDGQNCFLRIRQFVESDDDIEISREIAKKYKFENFDVIEILNQNGVVKVVTINGVKIPDDFENIKICGTPAKRGEKRFFNLCTKEEINKEIENVIKQTKNTNLKVFIFSDNEYSSKNVECVTYNKNASYSAIYKSFMMFVGQCEKALYESNNSLIIIDEIKMIEYAIESFDEDVSMRIKKHLRETVENHLLLGNVLVVYQLDEVVTY